MKISKREYILIGVVLVLLIVVSLSLFSSFFNQKHEEYDEDWLFVEEFSGEEPIKDVIIPKIIVDVKGAVALPGVYEMNEGERIIDAINMAGGMLEGANSNQINFAAILSDEMVVYVPLIGDEDVINEIVSISIGGSSQGKIRINHATSAELEQLNGIGPSKAAAIISYREQNGAFKTEEDLLNVSGIGAKSFEKIKDEITVK